MRNEVQFNLKDQKKKKKSVPPRCKGTLETERNMWYVSETKVMKSLGSTLMEKNVMEAGCVMSSYRHSICTLERAEKRKYSNVFSCVLQAAL